MFANFADQFTAEGDTRLSDANKNKKRIARGFVVTDAMLPDFRDAARRRRRSRSTRKRSRRTTTFIRAMIHYDIDLALFGIEEARRNLIAKDPQAQFALSSSARPQRLTELAQTRPRAAEGGKRTNRAFGPYILGSEFDLAPRYGGLLD